MSMVLGLASFCPTRNVSSFLQHELDFGWSSYDLWFAISNTAPQGNSLQKGLTFPKIL